MFNCTYGVDIYLYRVIVNTHFNPRYCLIICSARYLYAIARCYFHHFYLFFFIFMLFHACYVPILFVTFFVWMFFNQKNTVTTKTLHRPPPQHKMKTHRAATLPFSTNQITQKHTHIVAHQHPHHGMTMSHHRQLEKVTKGFKTNDWPCQWSIQNHFHPSRVVCCEFATQYVSIPSINNSPRLHLSGTPFNWARYCR